MSGSKSGKRSGGIINNFLKNVCHFLLQAYIIIMAVVYPLYLGREGYARIGEDKYFFYHNVTVGMLFLVLITSILCLLTWPGFWGFLKQIREKLGSGRSDSPEKLTVRRSGRQEKADGRAKFGYRGKAGRFSATEWAVTGFIGAALISFFLSPYRETAWLGAEGWHMGLKTLLCMTAVYLYLSRMWRYSGGMWAGFMVGGAVVCFLGICNRLSFYPIPFRLVTPEFISTLGNINWFAGYLAVIWPIGAGLAVFAEKRPVRLAAGAVALMAFGAGMTQGSNSIFLSFAAVFYLLLFLCLSEWKKYGIRWLGLAAGWCIVGQVIRIFRVLLPGRYNYATDNWCGMVTGSSFSILLLVAVILVYLVIGGILGRKPEKVKILKRILLALPLGGILLYALLVAVNTGTPGGILGLENNRLFVFDQAWGSGRGGTWAMGGELFSRMKGREKLFGMGPDSFMAYLYSFTDMAEEAAAHYGSAMLANAHNEWITMLMNLGVVGTAAYLGIFVTLLWRFLKGGVQGGKWYLPAVCAFSYLIHNMVSFGQILNMPFLFIIMGIGESSYRQSYEKEELNHEKTRRI